MSLSTQIRYKGGIEAIKKANLTWNVYRSESHFYSAFYLIFSLHYNLLSFLGPPDVFNRKRWGKIFILDFVRNTGVIHKKVGPAKCEMRIAECEISSKPKAQKKTIAFLLKDRSRYLDKTCLLWIGHWRGFHKYSWNPLPFYDMYLESCRGRARKKWAGP
jgi:hypothetical protein